MTCKRRLVLMSWSLWLSEGRRACVGCALYVV